MPTYPNLSENREQLGKVIILDLSYSNMKTKLKNIFVELSSIPTLSGQIKVEHKINCLIWKK